MNDGVTYDDIMRAVDKIGGMPSDPFGINKFYGMPIIEVQPRFRPKIQIDDKFKHCTDEFRIRMNNWLQDRFGVVDESTIPPDKVFIMNNRVILARPETALLLSQI